MSALEQIRRQGFTLKPVDAGLYIEPIDELTDTQRQWIVDHKPQLRLELLSERWEWFLSLAIKHGMSPIVVSAEFPTEEDRLDVIEPAEHDDDRLRACMATLCRDLRLQQRQRNYEAGSWLPVEHEL